MEELHYTLRITGLVQGVWFRKTAVEEALRLGLSGYAKNMDDGSVLIEAEGERAPLDQLVAWCHVGPPRARVDRVEMTIGPVQGFSSFQTIR